MGSPSAPHLGPTVGLPSRGPSLTWVREGGHQRLVSEIALTGSASRVPAEGLRGPDVHTGFHAVRGEGSAFSVEPWEDSPQTDHAGANEARGLPDETDAAGTKVRALQEVCDRLEKVGNIGGQALLTMRPDAEQDVP